MLSSRKTDGHMNIDIELAAHKTLNNIISKQNSYIITKNLKNKVLYINFYARKLIFSRISMSVCIILYTQIIKHGILI